MNRFFSFRHCIDLFLDFVTLFRKLMLILAFNEKVSQRAARAGGKAGLLLNLWEMGGGGNYCNPRVWTVEIGESGAWGQP